MSSGAAEKPTCGGQKFVYVGDVAIGYHCILERGHPPPCSWELDEEPAPSASGSGTYPALPRRGPDSASRATVLPRRRRPGE